MSKEKLFETAWDWTETPIPKRQATDFERHFHERTGEPLLEAYLAANGSSSEQRDAPPVTEQPPLVDNVVSLEAARAKHKH